MNITLALHQNYNLKLIIYNVRMITALEYKLIRNVTLHSRHLTRSSNSLLLSLTNIYQT